jgi:hypothetical protein
MLNSLLISHYLWYNLVMDYAEHLGLNPSLYRVHKYDYSKSIGGALLSIHDPLPELDDLVMAQVVRDVYLEVERLEGEIPETLPIVFQGHSVLVCRHGWHDNVGYYSATRYSFEQVPYWSTMR